jgi:hypothetical protein
MHVNHDVLDVLHVLEHMRGRGTYHTFCERRKGGQSWSYRIVRGRGRRVDYDVLKHEFGPVIRSLKAEGRKNMATMCPTRVAELAVELERILERLADVSHHRDTPSKGVKANG